MTKILYDDILYPMKTLGNIVFPEDDMEFIRSGLAAVSGKGRRVLKDMAQTLVAAQEQRAIIRHHGEQGNRDGAAR